MEKSADRNNWSSYQLGSIYLFSAERLENDKEKVVLANTIFGLFANLSKCIEDDYTQKYKSVRWAVDSRLQRMILSEETITWY